MKLKNIKISALNVRNGEYIEETIADLAESIQENGLFSKLLLRKMPGSGDEYEAIAGGRRYLALVKAYGEDYDLPNTDYLVKDESDFDALVDSITENVHRINLSPLQMSDAANKLKAAKKGISTKEIAKIMWASEAKIKRVLILKEDLEYIPESVKRELAMTEEGEPNFTDAHWDAIKKSKLDLGDADKLKTVCDFIMDNDVPASRVADAVNRFLPKETPAEGNMGPEPDAPPSDPSKIGEDVFVGILDITPEGLVNVIDKSGVLKPFDIQYYADYAKQSDFKVSIKAKFLIKSVGGL